VQLSSCDVNEALTRCELLRRFCCVRSVHSRSIRWTEIKNAPFESEPKNHWNSLVHGPNWIRPLQGDWAKICYWGEHLWPVANKTLNAARIRERPEIRPTHLWSLPVFAVYAGKAPPSLSNGQSDSTRQALIRFMYTQPFPVHMSQVVCGLCVGHTIELCKTAEPIENPFGGRGRLRI